MDFNFNLDRLSNQRPVERALLHLLHLLALFLFSVYSFSLVLSYSTDQLFWLSSVRFEKFPIRTSLRTSESEGIWRNRKKSEGSEGSEGSKGSEKSEGIDLKLKFWTLDFRLSTNLNCPSKIKFLNQVSSWKKRQVVEWFEQERSNGDTKQSTCKPENSNEISNEILSENLN